MPPSERVSSYSSLVALAQSAERFPRVTEPGVTKSQLLDQYKVMKEAGSLKEFAPTNEKELEDCVDASARPIKARGVCVPIFQIMWAGVSSESLAATIMDKNTDSYEGLVSEVALELFPHSLC
eukprot:GHVN01075130.1.p1 GENE.GHVN01075130.1~~GHVN01075130.1.p1  ORF type:complete len:123 (+),score=11.83 GHVN01075130.1:213-581(+)